MELRFSYALENPGALCVSLKDNETAFGISQEWMPSARMRRGGCGPCTAANMLFYLSRKSPELALLCPYAQADAGSLTLRQSIRFVCGIWKHLYPGPMGVNTAQMFVSGAMGYVRQTGIRLRSRQTHIPGITGRYEPFSTYANFIQEGLDRDCPVAFLNLSNGTEKELDGWHWVTIVSMDRRGDDREVYVEIADDTEKKTVNFGEWFQSTFLGGALVYFHEAP